MFADLPGFTKLTETYGADVAPFLTEFLTLATQAIHREGGTVDKFIGDCIMGLWNAPMPEAQHALRACRAADAIRRAMRALPRPDGRQSAPSVRIGINSGVALIGNVGSAERLSYTAIGDVVNVASRLEALGKTFEVEILISEATRAQCGTAIMVRSLGATAIRGRAEPLQIFELVALAGDKVEGMAGPEIEAEHAGVA